MTKKKLIIIILLYLIKCNVFGYNFGIKTSTDIIFIPFGEGAGEKTREYVESRDCAITGASWITDLIGNPALNFDGNDYVNLGIYNTFSGTQHKKIWIKFYARFNSNSNEISNTIIHVSDSVHAVYYVSPLEDPPYDNCLYVSLHGGYAIGYYEIDEYINKWTIYDIVYDNYKSTMVAFANANALSNIYRIWYDNTYALNDKPIYIGCRSVFDRFYYGDIAWLVIRTYSPTIDEIAEENRKIFNNVQLDGKNIYDKLFGIFCDTLYANTLYPTKYSYLLKRKDYFTTDKIIIDEKITELSKTGRQDLILGQPYTKTQYSISADGNWSRLDIVSTEKEKAVLDQLVKDGKAIYLGSRKVVEKGILKDVEYDRPMLSNEIKEILKNFNIIKSTYEVVIATR